MTRWIMIATALAVIATFSAGIAIAADDGSSEPKAMETSTVSDDGRDSDDGTVPEEDAVKAADAALATTGGGTVTGVETDDNGAGYEVEVRKSDGSAVEVQLGNDFQPRADEADDDTDEADDTDEGTEETEEEADDD